MLFVRFRRSFEVLEEKRGTHLRVETGDLYPMKVIVDLGEIGALGGNDDCLLGPSVHWQVRLEHGEELGVVKYKQPFALCNFVSPRTSTPRQLDGPVPVCCNQLGDCLNDPCLILGFSKAPLEILVYCLYFQTHFARIDC